MVLPVSQKRATPTIHARNLNICCLHFVFQAMQKAMEGESVQKFLLYSGHDSTRMLLVFIVIITIVILLFG